MDIQERLRLGREALQDNVCPSKDEAIFLYDLIHDLQQENIRLNKVIGRYAGQIQEVIGKQQSLCREGLTIARNMFRTDLD